MHKPGNKPPTPPTANESSDKAAEGTTSPDARTRSTPPAPKAWYGGNTWRRGSKATPVTQVARESILAATDKASKIVTTPNSLARDTAIPSRSPSIYLSRSIKDSSKSLPPDSADKKPDSGPNQRDISQNSTLQQSMKSQESAPQQSTTADSPNKKVNASSKRKRSRDHVTLGIEPESKTQQSAPVACAGAQEGKTPNQTSVRRSWLPLFGDSTRSLPQKVPDTALPSTDEPVQPSRNDDLQKPSQSIGTPDMEQDTIPRTWLGLWNSKNPMTVTASDTPAPTTTARSDAPTESESRDKAGATDPRVVTTVKSPGWAFWSREAPRKSNEAESETRDMGELALAGSPSQSRPESAFLDGAPKAPGTRPRPVTSSRNDGSPQPMAVKSDSESASAPPDRPAQEKSPLKTTRPPSQKQNLLLPSIANTYSPAERPSFMQSLNSWWQQSQASDLVKARFVEKPPQIRRCLVIVLPQGVHGYFPAPLIRSVLGQPTGTSIRFAEGAASAIQSWSEAQGYSCQIEKVALEGEGKILERVDLLWKLLLNWIDNIRRADFVMVACHSQGVPVAMMLIAKLIDFGCVRDARIGVCAMAGVNLGPFIDYKSRWIGGSAGELFDFGRADSPVSKDYEAALATALKSGVKISFIGSIDDQLVSLHSSTFSNIQHPHIYRAVFVNGSIHTPDFLTHLVGFALKLRNLGISDHGLIRELSSPLAGSLYSGDGHSKIYEDDAVYYLAVQNALQTTSVGEVPLTRSHDAVITSQNPYILPFSLRGVLEEDYVKIQLHKETTELLQQFDEWKPSTKVLKDVKFRLEGVSLAQKKGSKPIPPAPSSIRKEVVYSAPAAKSTANTQSNRSRPELPKARPVSQQVNKAQVNGTRRKVAQKRKQSQQTPLLSDSDSDEDDTTIQPASKRTKTPAIARSSISRRLRCESAFEEDGSSILPLIQGADVASVEKSSKYRLAFPQIPEEHIIVLQYPSASQQERFDLVEPSQSDEFKPLDDIKETIEHILDFYVPGTEAALFKDDGDGLLRRMRRARDKRNGPLYISLIHEWNEAMVEWRKKGLIAKFLDDNFSLDLRLIERVLTQTYARTVSPRVQTLRQYENGTDNVYGELLPKFVSEIFQTTELGPEHVFIDLGSGVGNVVLQAALEIGCESWGCEIMENACVLAELQEQEFKARCRLWGFAIGNINLHRGDFLENTTIHKALQKADVILVNNQAFTPELNAHLTSHFLDLKDGCQIVSLKSFVPAGHKITSRNLNSAYNVLDVVEKRYYSACVSWTDAPGSYFVSKKDSSRLRAFMDRGIPA
ncbi:MAG: hypothetical protein Q9174_000736 [Haloplaca sp. 1 TL-2023]